MHLLCHSWNLSNILILKQQLARERLIFRCGCSFLKPSVRKRTVAGAVHTILTSNQRLWFRSVRLNPHRRNRGLAIFDCCRRLWLSVKLDRRRSLSRLAEPSMSGWMLSSAIGTAGSTALAAPRRSGALIVPLPPQPPSRRPPTADLPSENSPRFSRPARCDRLESDGPCRRTQTTKIVAWPCAFSRLSKAA